MVKLENNLKQKKTKIGILGGTFDPAHKGHLEISKQAKKILELKNIIWAITKQNPFKNTSKTNLKNRIKFAKKFIGNNNFIKVKFYEEKVFSNKTIDLIDYLNKDKKFEIYFIMGADNLIKELRLRLAQKNMETGELYVKLKAYDSAIVAYKIVIKDYYDTTYYRDANLEVIRCLVLLDKNEEAEEFLDSLNKSDESLVDDSFKKIASDILNNNS